MRAKIIVVALLALVSSVQCVAQTYYGGLRGTVMIQRARRSLAAQ